MAAGCSPRRRSRGGRRPRRRIRPERASRRRSNPDDQFPLVLLFMVLVMAAAFPAVCQTAPVAQEQTTALEPPTPPAAKPDTPLTPEKRADVFMARKMYREAIEAYEQEPVRTPVLWNKIGIAYHQMMQLGTAKRCYEKSLKLNPKYP